MPGLPYQQQDVLTLAQMRNLTEDAIRNNATHNVPTLMRMGILTEDEIRNPAFYIEHYRCKNQAMERDLMQVQAAVHGLMQVRKQNREAMHKIATQNGKLAQLLSRPEVQHHRDVRHLAEFIPRCWRLHKQVTEVLNNEMMGAVEVMYPKDLQMPVQAQQAKDPKDLQLPAQAQQAHGKPEDPQFMSQSSRRKRRNRRRRVGKGINAKASVS